MTQIVLHHWVIMKCDEHCTDCTYKYLNRQFISAMIIFQIVRTVTNFYTNVNFIEEMPKPGTWMRGTIFESKYIWQELYSRGVLKCTAGARVDLEQPLNLIPPPHEWQCTITLAASELWDSRLRGLCGRSAPSPWTLRLATLALSWAQGGGKIKKNI